MARGTGVASSDYNWGLIGFVGLSVEFWIVLGMTFDYLLP
jgi:hypothetical protein